MFPPVLLLAIVNCPVSEPDVKGANSILRVAACPGFKVTGNVTPETEKALPEIDAALTVTGSVSDEVSVMDCATVEFSTIAPNVTLEELVFSELTAACSCMGKVCKRLPAVAVIVAD